MPRVANIWRRLTGCGTSVSADREKQLKDRETVADATYYQAELEIEKYERQAKKHSDDIALAIRQIAERLDDK